MSPTRWQIEPPPLAPGAGAQWLIAALVALGPFSLTMYQPALPSIARSLNITTAQVQPTLTVYLASFAIGQLIYGPMSDHFGRRRTLLLGLAIFVAGALACALANSAAVLIAARVLQGLGACAGPALGRAGEDPGTVRQRVKRLDLGAFGGEPQRLWADAEMGGRLGQVEPGLDGIIGRAMDRDLVMRAKRRHALARPAVAVACGQLVSVQQSGDEIVVGDQHEVPDGGNDVGRGAAALAASTSRQAQLGVNAAHPVDQENDRPSLDVDIGDHLADHGADDALLEPGIGRRRFPDGREIMGERREGGKPRLRPSWGGAVVSGDFGLGLAKAGERPVPPRLKLRCDEAVLGIGRVVLPESPICLVARRFQIAQHRLAGLIMPAGRFRLGLGRRGDRAWFDDLEQSGLNGVVDPQAAEGDAARLAIIEQAPVAGIAWNVVLHAAVTDGQLAPTAPAADETSQQRVAVLGRAMMTARGHVLAHHPADRLRTLPIDVPVVRAGLERQPFAARLAAALRPNAR